MTAELLLPLTVLKVFRYLVKAHSPIINSMCAQELAVTKLLPAFILSQRIVSHTMAVI